MGDQGINAFVRLEKLPEPLKPAVLSSKKYRAPSQQGAYRRGRVRAKSLHPSFY